MPSLMPQHVRQQVADIWEADASLTWMLACLILMLFVVVPLAGVGLLPGVSELLVAGTFSLLAVSGVFAVTRSSSARIAGLVAVTAPIALGWYVALTHDQSIDLLRGFSTLVALSWMAGIALAHVLRAGPVTLARLQGSIAVYLLAALIFAELYWLNILFNPDAIHFARPPVSRLEEQAQVVYFSLTTLTTLGYGDILPNSNIARSLATLEGLMGQLYPVLLIGRLVSLHVSRADQGPPQPREQ